MSAGRGHAEDPRTALVNLDTLPPLARLEVKLDLLLADRLDRRALARLSERLRAAAGRLARAVADAGGAPATFRTDPETPQKENATMSAEIDRLTERVRACESVMDGAGTLIGALAARIRDTAGDRAAALALADEVDQKTAALAQAVTENTSAQP